MNYIVLDLEWNQSLSGQSNQNHNLLFEIIEIGATKLDKKFNIIDKYGSIIKPKIYRRLHPRIRELLNYDETLLRTGRPFDVVFREFKNWCGEDYIFCTWGSLDLTYLQENMEFYHLKSFDFPLRFYDLQEIFARNHYNDTEHMPSLEKAVKELNIEINEPFHCAENDAYYTAMVFKKMNRKHLSDMYSFDYFHYPTCPEEEILSEHTHYTQYITRTFKNKMEALRDKNVTAMNCHKCNRKLKKKIRWFANNSSTQLSVGKCWGHGLMCGKIRFKTTKDGKIFVVKTIEKISRKEYEQIRDRQNELRTRRRDKRNQKRAV